MCPEKNGTLYKAGTHSGKTHPDKNGTDIMSVPVVRLPGCIVPYIQKKNGQDMKER